MLVKQKNKQNHKKLQTISLKTPRKSPYVWIIPALQIPPALSAVDTAALRAAARAAQRARSNCFSRKATERLNDYCGATREMWNSNFSEYILSEDSLPHNQNVKLYTV